MFPGVLRCIAVDGEGAAKYIKTTNNKNANIPIIAVSAYGSSEPADHSNLFAGYLAKPVQKADLVAVMRQLGFKTSTVPGRGPPRVSTTSTVGPMPPPPVPASALVSAR